MPAAQRDRRTADPVACSVTTLESCRAGRTTATVTASTDQCAARASGDTGATLDRHRTGCTTSRPGTARDGDRAAAEILALDGDRAAGGIGAAAVRDDVDVTTRGVLPSKAGRDVDIATLCAGTPNGREATRDIDAAAALCCAGAGTAHDRQIPTCAGSGPRHALDL